MSIDSIALVTIVGMALGTYMTRAGGFWLVSRLTPSRFLTSTLQYLPGTMLIAPVAPELAKGGADRIVASYFHRPDYVAIWKPDAGAYWGHRSRLVVEIGGACRCGYITISWKEQHMIARTWHGVDPASMANEYMNYLNRTGLPDYRGTDGNRGVQVLRRIEGDDAHFLLITLWESFEAIRKFAGDERERARYFPEDEAFLKEMEPKVTHCEVMG